MTEQEDNVFVTTAGVHLRIKPIPPFKRDAIFAMREKPEYAVKPPTYEVDTVAGDKMQFEHDETTLETKEDKARWKKYLADKQVAERKWFGNLTKMYIRQAVDLNDIPAPTAADDESLRSLDIEPETDPAQRKIQHLLSEILVTEADSNGLVQAINKVSETGHFKQAEALELFPDKVEGQAAVEPGAKTG